MNGTQDGTKLIDKANHFQSNSSWRFLYTTKDAPKIFIQTLPSNKVLEKSSGPKVFLAKQKDKTEDSSSQLWIKGEPSNEGYFTLKQRFVSSIGNIEKATYLGFPVYGQSGPFLAVHTGKKKLGRL